MRQDRRNRFGGWLKTGWLHLACQIICVVGLSSDASAQCPPRGGVALCPVQSVGPDGIRRLDAPTVRLAAVYIPEKIAAEARTRIRTLAGEEARFIPVQPRPDRYGRVVADVIGPSGWLQERLVSEGLALAAPRPGETACLEALVALEAIARSRALGIFAFEQPIQASDTTALEALLGRFVLVEGRVSSVGVRDRATYVNFSREWQRDLAVVIPETARRAFQRDGVDLSRMGGQMLRVRGVLDATLPPRLRLEVPAALELIAPTPRRGS